MQDFNKGKYIEKRENNSGEGYGFIRCRKTVLIRQRIEDLYFRLILCIFYFPHETVNLVGLGMSTQAGN